MKSSNLLIFPCLLLSIFTQAQLSPAKDLPFRKSTLEEPYLFPINPGKQNWLAGTMGELRNTHFHAGIDIRTNNMTGMPVRATQRGYISRAIVNSYGYGQVLFVTHPDGNVSVYAHLDQFKGKAGDFILNKHYEKKSFNIDLEFLPDQFPVNRGDTIALSGNTGGSTGPHLHFEIRDSQNEALNPLDFKFDEIKDGLPPVPQKIALKTIDINSRINGHFGRSEFFLLRNGSTYSLPGPISVQGKIGIELLAFDRMDFSQFRCGINEIEVRVDSQKVFVQKIKSINFNETQGIVALLNFQTLKTRGLHFNKLYIEDGNPLKYYESGVNRGEINISDKPSIVQINLKDTYGNESNIRMKLLPGSSTLAPMPVLTKPYEYDISGNVMTLRVRPCGPKGKIVFFEKGSPTQLEPSYLDNSQQVYLIDLQKNIPDSAQTCQGNIRFDVIDKIPSGTQYTFYSDLADIRFRPSSLYDTLFFNLSKSDKNKTEVFSIGRNTEPLNDSVEIILKPTTQTEDAKVSVYHIEGRLYEFVGGRWQNGKIKFNTSKLGDFILLKDSIAPVVHRIHCNSASARFRIIDNLSGIASYEASVNGQWLLMKYDYKTGILQSERLDKSKPLQGDFQLKVKDKLGNEKIYTQKIL